jgi:hypothetical protein
MAAPPSSAFQAAVQRLNEREASGEISRWAIGGDFAFVFHGEPFDTATLTVIVATAATAVVDPGGQLDDLTIQVQAAAGPLEDEAVRDALKTVVAQQPALVIGPEHAVAIALARGRAKEKLCILRLQESAPDALDYSRLQDIVGRHGLVERWRLSKTQRAIRLLRQAHSISLLRQRRSDDGSSPGDHSTKRFNLRWSCGPSVHKSRSSDRVSEAAGRNGRGASRARPQLQIFVG